MQDDIKLGEIVVKDKLRDNHYGRYGWYMPTDKRVCVMIPETVNNIRHDLKYSGLTLFYHTRVELMVAVMAHELRHAWQFQHHEARFKPCKALRERDAEQYMYGMLAKWRAQFK